MSAGIIIQARSGSERFPRKVLKPLAGYPVIWHVIKRAKRAFIPNGRVVVATSTLKADDEVALEAKKAGADVYRGAPFNVLKRFYDAATYFNIDPIIRITGDCPFIQPSLIHRMYQTFLDGYDYVCIDAMNTFPNGLDAEMFKYKHLEDIHKKAVKAKDHNHDKDLAYSKDREHVSVSIKNNPSFKKTVLRYSGKKKAPKMRLTLDYEEDYTVLQNLADALFEKNVYFNYNDIIDFMVEHPEICQLNADLDDLKADDRTQFRNIKDDKTGRHPRYRRG